MALISGARDCRIPIFPDRFVTEPSHDLRHLFGRTGVGDFELPSGVGAVAGRRGPFAGGLSEGDDSPAFGSMEILLARASVATGFGVASSADVRNAERNEPVAKPSRFPGREDQAGIWKCQPKSAHELHEVAV